MMRDAAGAGCVRRARPVLGTLVEIGIVEAAADPLRDHAAALAVASTAACAAAFAAAFAAIDEVQARLSRFDPASDVARFNAAPRDARIEVSLHTRRVLAMARRLQRASGGAFDVTLGTAPRGWRCAAGLLRKLDAAARIDLGGIGKGYAVDRAVDALQNSGVRSGWVNAGGDLRVFGEAELSLGLRDEREGGARAFAVLRDGAFATSHFGPRSRDRAAAARQVQAHVSVAAPQCLWADALTKVVAISGDADHPLLRHYAAQAWLHA